MAIDYDNIIYNYLKEVRGEEYADLFFAPEKERISYLCWWQANFNTEADRIRDLGFDPDYFASYEEALAFHRKIEMLASEYSDKE